MDDFRINILFGDESFETDFISMEFENIPKIVVKFIISRKINISTNYESFETMKLIYANDKSSIMDLSIDIKHYINILNSKNINELILKGYLEEIYTLLEDYDLVKDEGNIKKKVYKKV